MAPSYGPVKRATRLREATLPGFVLAEASYQPGALLEPHEHEQPCLTFVLEGTFEERIGRRPAMLVRWSLLIKPGGVEHTDLIGPGGARILFIEPAGEWETALAEALPVLGAVLHTEQEPVAALGRRLWMELQDAGPFWPLIAEGLILEMLALAGREPRPSLRSAPPWLRHFRDRLEANLLDPPSMAGLAMEAGVHPTYASRAFHQFFGMTAVEFVQRRRVELAASMLAGTELPASRIAHECGFADQSHLTRLFRRYTGVTPREYRRTCGAGPPRRSIV